MKYMVTWRVHDEHRGDALKGFSAMTPADEQADLGEGVTLIGRWHDVVGFTGVAIAESDDPAAVAGWLLNWNLIMDIELTPVLDDAETRALGKAKLG